MLSRMNSSATSVLLWVAVATGICIAWGLVRRAAVAQEFSPEQLGEQLRAGAQVVDVRTPEEFRQGHLPGATNVPLDQLSRLAPKVFPDKTQPLLLYCRSGRRSEMALQELRSLGYSNVWNLGGLTRAQKILKQAGPPPAPATNASPAPPNS
jgi:phage shock protein E